MTEDDEAKQKAQEVAASLSSGTRQQQQAHKLTPTVSPSHHTVRSGLKQEASMSSPSPSSANSSPVAAPQKRCDIKEEEEEEIPGQPGHEHTARGQSPSGDPETEEHATMSADSNTTRNKQNSPTGQKSDEQQVQAASRSSQQQRRQHHHLNNNNNNNLPSKRHHHHNSHHSSPAHAGHESAASQATSGRQSGATSGGGGPAVSAEYLAQLIKDKKHLAGFPAGVFLHVPRLIDDEIQKVRNQLFQLNDVVSLRQQPLELPEPQGEQVSLQEKIYVPVEEHPEYNFVGRLLGPRGMTAKQLEQETGCKIMIRGKGSMRDKKKVCNHITHAHHKCQQIHSLQ